MTTAMPSREQIANAADLDFDAKRSDKDVSICIEASPAGVTVRVDYIGTLGSIPAAVERLRSAGILDLVSAARPATATAPLGGTPARTPTQRVEPVYQPDGSACCPVHKRVLKEGKYGLYCSAKDRETDEYCNLKFKD